MPITYVNCGRTTNEIERSHPVPPNKTTLLQAPSLGHNDTANIRTDTSMEESSLDVFPNHMDIAQTLYNTVSIGQEEIDRLAAEHKVFMAQCDSTIAEMKELVNRQMEKREERKTLEDIESKKAKDLEMAAISAQIEEKAATIDRLMEEKAKQDALPLGKPRLVRRPAQIKTTDRTNTAEARTNSQKKGVGTGGKDLATTKGRWK